MLPLCLPLNSPKEPNAKPRGAECRTGAECETPCFKNFGGSADFEVNLWALKEETDGIFLSYTVVQGIEVTSVINILCGGREEGVSLSNLPSLHLH